MAMKSYYRRRGNRGHAAELERGEAIIRVGGMTLRAREICMGGHNRRGGS